MAHEFWLTSITMRPTDLSSAVMSKKTRGSTMFLAAVAKLRRSVSKDGRLGRAVAPKWLNCMKVESIDSRQIDLNAILYFWKLAENRSRDARSELFVEWYQFWWFYEIFAGYFTKILCNKRMLSIMNWLLSNDIATPYFQPIESTREAWVHVREWPIKFLFIDP